MDSKPVRTVLAEPFAIQRSGLETMIQNASGIELVGTAISKVNALALCIKQEPAIVVIGIYHPYQADIEFARLLRDKLPEVGILVVANNKQEINIEEALDSGVSDIVFFDATESELTQAILSMDQGNPALATQIVIHLARHTHYKTYVELTKREVEVLSLMMEGLTNGHIAERLSVSPYTIKNHVSNLYSKLGVHNRTEAVALAFKDKLILGLAS